MNQSVRKTKQQDSTKKSPLEETLKTRFITSLAELCKLLSLPNDLVSKLSKANRQFPVFIPESLLDRISQGTLDDPILRQFLPDPRELEKTEGFSFDPLCEQKDSHVYVSNKHADCILQKYAGRALIITNNTCSARCRFCFRRYYHQTSLFPVPTKFHNNKSESSSYNTEDDNLKTYFDSIFASITQDPSIHEIIFSGGDPLTLSNNHLKSLLYYISSLKNVNRVRFHSRVPILTPQRVDNAFPSELEIVNSSASRPLVLHIVLHVNSPKEINYSVVKALKALRKLGYVLTSQTVLLKGINDESDVLVELFEKLIDAGVIPYYLHQLDHVQGAAHYEVSVEKGLALMQEIALRLPGYAVPKYVREIPGRGSKVNLQAEFGAKI